VKFERDKVMSGILSKLNGGLIVSCQAHEGEPLRGSVFMARVALACKMGGALAIRASGKDDIKAIKNEIDLPVIGIKKVLLGDGSIFITPDLKSAEEIIEAGADIVAVDCTFRQSIGGKAGFELIEEIKKRFNIPVMADISNLKESLNALKYGADIISTTLSGYTPDSPCLEGPDFNLIAEIRNNMGERVCINAEGRFSKPEEVVNALKLGANFVTVGSAITRPKWITENFANAINEYIKG
jgi:N-acylglucosamine-6-phosphate 2-epimerase